MPKILPSKKELGSSKQLLSEVWKYFNDTPDPIPGFVGDDILKYAALIPSLIPKTLKRFNKPEEIIPYLDRGVTSNTNYAAKAWLDPKNELVLPVHEVGTHNRIAKELLNSYDSPVLEASPNQEAMRQGLIRFYRDITPNSNQVAVEMHPSSINKFGEFAKKYLPEIANYFVDITNTGKAYGGRSLKETLRNLKEDIQW